MRKYIIKRLLLSVPTLFLLSVIVFTLSKWMPGDPAERLTGAIETDYELPDEGPIAGQYDRTYRHLGLHLPLFYFSIQPTALDPKLREISDGSLRASLKSLMYLTGRAEGVMEYHRLTSSFIRDMQRLGDTACISGENLNRFERLYRSAHEIENLREMHRLLETSQEPDGCVSTDHRERLLSSIEDLIQVEKGSFWWWPKFYWHGTNNQYHRWISDVLRGNWGYSLRDGSPVGTRIYSALGYTLWLSLWSILLTFIPGIPLGLFLAVSEKKYLKNSLRTLVYGLYSTPLFWLATLLLIFFTSPDYGSWTHIFPSPAALMLQDSGTGGLWASIGYFALPVICLSLNGMAFIARQMEQSAVREKFKTYILMSKARGNTDFKTLWHHLFPNALFPMITLLGAVLPALISGSLVIEVIFNIPGMGRLMWDSIFGQDWNTVYAVLMLGGILTIAGQLLADLLYVKNDPRVHYD